MRSAVPRNRIHAIAKATFFGAAIAISVAMLACGKATPTELVQAPLVQVYLVESSGRQVLELRGSVASEGRLRLGFKASGVLGPLRVREGDTVHAGQVLAFLDEVDARSQFQSATAFLARVRREAERAERLAREGVIPSNDREDARNQLEAAEAQWRLAQDGLQRTRLVAPVPGTIFQRLAEPGEAVGSGTPVLVLDTTNQLVIRSGVTERELPRLRVGQEATLQLEDGTTPFRGIVRSLSAAPSAADGLYTVEILPDQKALHPGTLLRIRFESIGDHGVFRIPLPALVHRQGQDYVFVINVEAPGFAVQARPVDVAKLDGLEVVVRKGLNAGERIVAEGAFFLQDAQSVRILE